MGLSLSSETAPLLIGIDINELKVERMKRNSGMIEKIFSVVFLGILCVYFLSIIYINFSGTPSFFCTDMYSDMLYAMEVWKHKTLFPPDWVFGNQLYIVATPVLAALVYGIAGNALIAMAISTTVYGILVLTAFFWMIKPVVEEREARWFGGLLMMTIMLYFGGTAEQTNGWQLFFTMCSYYACYAVTAFWAFGCYLRAEKAHGIGFYCILGMTCILSFGTGMQSLRQTAVMTLPLLGVTFFQIVFQVVHKKKWVTRSLGVAMLFSVCNLLGVICTRFLNISQHMIFGEVRLAFFPNGKDSIIQCARNIFSLFERPGWREYAAFLLLMTLFLIAMIYIGRRLFKEKNNEKASDTIKLLGLLGFAVFAIIAAELLTTMVVRNIYYFMIYPVLGFVFAKSYAYGRRYLRTGIVLLMTFVLLLPSFGKLKESCTLAYTGRTGYEYEVSNYLREHGYTTIYSDFNQGEKIAIASGFEISAGFWDGIPFSSVPYLCDRRVYDTNGTQCVYLFMDAQNEKIGLEKAEERGYELIPLKSFPENGIKLYTAQVNLMDRPQFE